MNVRIGVLGGTFDPIHRGHLDLADAALTQLALDELLVVPSHIPPHRSTQPRASAYHRFAMVGLAVLDRERLRACDMELSAGGTSYTSDTLERLRRRGYTPSQLFFIAGADAFADIATWREYPALLDRCHFAVVSRPGFPVAALPALLPDLASRMRPSGDAVGRPALPSIFLIDADTANVSSTQVRERLNEGHQATDILPPGVDRYVRQHSLYVFQATAKGLHEHI